ncbi:phosphoglycerol transferase [Dorea longicatena]|uniref:Phosphoglycerol transferase n=1 Tax=Dorea longicatena TaxID=88431 RepID=A0A3E5GKL9_9FIRM|nr:phosphoglycerol transferase [Dorea longicatena]
MMKKHKIFKYIGIILSSLLMVVSVLLAFSAKWMFDTWTSLTMDELVFHLTTSLEGTNTDMIKAYCLKCVVPAVICLAAVVAIWVICSLKKKNINKMMIVICLMGIVVIGTAVAVTWHKLNIGEYLKGQHTYSEFIDDNYADPSTTNVSFPEQKRNLIYIFLESMEATYSDNENGGAFKKNVIPELTELAQANEDFSGKSKKLNGGYAMPGATWTMGAMFAQTSGLPLSISIDDNAMDTQDTFFKDTTTLGDILQKEGYSQTLLIGSDATFGGRRLYFEEHGDYDILDYNYAIENGWIPEDYKVWWGYEDEKLFEFAKNKLTELSQQDTPFNLTMLTVDTHFEDGYICEKCPYTFGKNQYANVMACSSKQVKEFVDWVEQQSFAQNTTIVISGDHLTMDSDFCEDVDTDYDRKVYTTYINPAVASSGEKRRVYTTFDNFPTTIAALGAEIVGDRLGLGTNLFSDRQTLSEEYGIEKEKIELSKQSKLMHKMANINKGKVIEQDNDEQNEEESPEAQIKTKEQHIADKKYKIKISVDDLKNMKNGVQSASAAVWSNRDQSDLQWVPLAVQDDGKWTGKVNVKKKTKNKGMYNIHVYMIDGTGTQYNVAQDMVKLE